MESLTSAVDFSAVITAVLAVGAAIVGVVVISKGASMVINALKRA